ncbi:MAG: hypothetical protein MZV70_60315 [Desulfobacterales bacterium]|nr:hypothetical protein [Desulfobacterales bacterium]
MIELKNVCKSYNKGAVRAVDDLTLDRTARGDLRLPRPQRRRQDDDHQDDRRHPRPRRRDHRRSTGIDNRREPLAGQGGAPPTCPTSRRSTSGSPAASTSTSSPTSTACPAARARASASRRWLEAFELAAVAADPIQTYSHGMQPEDRAHRAPCSSSPAVLRPRRAAWPGWTRAPPTTSRRPCAPTATAAGPSSSRPTSWRSPRSSATASAIIHKGRLTACGTLEELRRRAGRFAVAGKDLPGADGNMRRLLRPARRRTAPELRPGAAPAQVLQAASGTSGCSCSSPSACSALAPSWSSAISSGIGQSLSSS